MRKAIVDVAMDRRGVLGRRGFLKAIGLGGAGATALSFTDLMAVNADEMRKNEMACIVLWMQGGPSQFETFDPKPDHENGGGTGVIETAVPGVRIAKGWDKVAAQMNEIALIRSMTNKEGNHQRATYQLHTGYVPSGSVKHPSFGSNVAAELGDPQFDLPQIVTIAGARGPAGLLGAGGGAGFLGVQYEPFLVSDPNRLPENTNVPDAARGRFQRRLGLLSRLEEHGYAKDGGEERVREHQALYDKTAKMMLSPRMQAFDLDQEPAELRDAYGRTPFGQGCLLARRLVDHGVTFVEVRMGNWDTHTDLNETVDGLTAQVDPAFGTLIEDLKRRGRLDKTLVVWMGEFGRTPKISARGGRDHFPRCFNVALAGGGVRGGRVIGASTPDGSDVKDRPVAVNDLLATFCRSLKVDPSKENISPQGRPIKIVDGGSPVEDLFA